MLSEKKIQKLKSKYFPKLQEIGLSHKWKEGIQLIHSDPAKGEFTNWMLLQLKNGFSIEDIIPTTEYFHRNRKLFQEKNINKYENLKQLEDIIKDFEKKKSLDNKNNVVKDSERTPIWSNDDYTLVRINSKNASQKYGYGTRWCITMSDSSYYEQYKAHNVLFYFLLPKSNNNEKFAFAVKRDMDNSINEIEIFNAEDDSVYDVPYYDIFDQIMISDAISQPKEILPKLVNGEASKEEFLSFIQIYIDQYKTALKLNDEYKINEAISAIEELKEYLGKYPEALFFISNKYPEISLAIDTSLATPELITKLYNRESKNNTKISEKNINIIAITNNTPPEILAQLANNDDVMIRQYIAQNQNTSSETLAQLTKDNDEYIIRSVYINIAQNPNTSPEVLKQLANNDDDYIRESVAKNPNTPPEILSQLANDDSEFVRRNVAQNPNTPIEVLKQLSNDYDENIRHTIAGNPNTPIEVLAQLANDDSEFVRRNVARNPNIPPEILAQLANDNDNDVKEIAVKTLNKKKQNNIPEEVIEPIVEPKVPIAEQYYQKLKDFPILPKDEDEILEIAKNSNISEDILNQLLQLQNQKVNDILLQNPGISENIKQKLRQENYLDKYVEAINIISNILKYASIYNIGCYNAYKIC